MDPNEKVRENRLRRAAKRQGLMLVKSRRRDRRASDYGTYGLIDPNRNAWVAWRGGGFGMDLDQVEAWLARPRRPKRKLRTDARQGGRLRPHERADADAWLNEQ